jgi:hypothetical protein
MDDGNRDSLKGFVAQLLLKIFSDPTRFSTPALGIAYTFNSLQTRVQAQVLHFMMGETIELKDSEAISCILQKGFGNPDPIATAGTKLANLK